ncbi:MAG: metallophosphoesterase family protein [Bacillota bacterium]
MHKRLAKFALLMALFAVSRINIRGGPAYPVVVYGDTRSNMKAHKTVLEAICKVRPEVVFHTGDMVFNGKSKREWASVTETIAVLGDAEFYPVIGNHDRGPVFFTLFNLPNNGQWYSVDRHYTHFIVLNSNAAHDNGSEQYRWLVKDLEGISPGIRFVVVLFHHPPFSSGEHADDEENILQTLVPLFERYGVDLVFCGHNHAYERFYYHDIYYLITGGGGAPLYGKTTTSPYSQVYRKTYHFCGLMFIDKQLVVDVYDPELNRIDQIAIDGKRGI